MNSVQYTIPLVQLSVYPISFHDIFPLVMRYENNILKQLMRWKPFYAAAAVEVALSCS